MTAESRSARLGQELVRLIDDGWELRERSPFEALMAVPFRGWPGWRVTLAHAALLVVTLGCPGFGVKDRYRLVLVSVDSAETIHRRTVSELPPLRHRRGGQWAVADTDGPAAPVAPGDTQTRGSDPGQGASAAPVTVCAPSTPSRGTGVAGSLVA